MPGLPKAMYWAGCSSRHFPASTDGVNRKLATVGEELYAPIDVVQVAGEQRFIIVLSHDCEFNTNKRNRLLVARLENLPGNLFRMMSYATSGLATTCAHVPLPAYRLMAPTHSWWPLRRRVEEEQIAVFTTTTPFPMKMKDDLVAVKRA